MDTMNTPVVEVAERNTATAFVQADHIVKSFGDHRAINDVSMHVAKGEVISLIGPSGAGKSTFLRCLNLLEVPESGTLSVAGDRIDFSGTVGRTQIVQLRRHAGMVFQSFNLFPHLTALRNVSLARSSASARDRPRPRNVRSRCSTGSGWQQRRTATRASARADNSSASPSHGPWRWTPT